jgi:hypothetical protein
MILRARCACVIESLPIREALLLSLFKTLPPGEGVNFADARDGRRPAVVCRIWGVRERICVRVIHGDWSGSALRRRGWWTLPYVLRTYGVHGVSTWTI